MKNPKGYTEEKFGQLGEALEERTWFDCPEIESSESYMCTGWYQRFGLLAIKERQNGDFAIYPNTDCFIGSASGVNFCDDGYSAFQFDNQ